MVSYEAMTLKTITRVSACNALGAGHGRANHVIRTCFVLEVLQQQSVESEQEPTVIRRQT